MLECFVNDPKAKVKWFKDGNQLEVRSNSMYRHRGGTGGPSGSPLKNHKNIGFLSNICPDHLLNHKAYKPSFSVGQPWARQRNAI